MRLGEVGSIRRLVLSGAAAALLAGSSAALARSHHHSRSHHHARRSGANKVIPEESGNTAAEPTGNQTPGAPAAHTPAIGPPAGLEFVPGPTPLPRSGNKQSGTNQSGNQKGANDPPPDADNSGPAGAPGKDSPAPARPGAMSKDPSPAARNDRAAGDAVDGATQAALIEPAAPAKVGPAKVAPAKVVIDTAVAKLFLGEPVYGAKGDQIGNLARIIPGPDGEVRSAVITWGGMFGYFQSHRTIAWPESGPSIQGGKLVLRAMSTSALHSAAAAPDASR